MTIETLAQIINDNNKAFVAGIVLWDDVVIEAAPIVGYMKKRRWTRAQVREHCKEKGWSITVVWQNERRDIDREGRSTDATVRRRHGHVQTGA